MAFSLGSFGPGGPCDCCVGCTATQGICALVTRFVSPFGKISCPIEMDCPAKLTMKDGSGNVVYSGDMSWAMGTFGDAAFYSACIHLTDHYLDPTLGGADTGPRYTRLQLYPVNPTTLNTVLVEHLGNLSSCADLIVQNDDGNYHAVTGNTQYSCDSVGLHGHWVTASGSGAAGTNFLWTLRTYLSVTDVYVEAKKFATACDPIFRGVVTGCNDMPLAGVAIQARNSSTSGTLLASGTTDSAGHYQLPALVGATNGNDVWVTYTLGRFSTGVVDLIYDANVGSATTWSPTQNSDLGTISLSPAFTYHCLTTCAQPIVETLHATHPVFGAVTYTYTGGSWTATITYSYPGLGGCAAKTVTISASWDGGGGYSEFWWSSSDCPDDAGGEPNTVFWTAGSFTCYQSGLAALLANFTFTPSSAAELKLYGAGLKTLPITE